MPCAHPLELRNVSVSKKPAKKKSHTPKSSALTAEKDSKIFQTSTLITTKQENEKKKQQ
jgi:hypothetical protein